MQAAKKGPAGIRWLRRGSEGHRMLLTARFTARILKNLRMHRPQQLITDMAKSNPRARAALWITAGLLTLAGLFNLLAPMRQLRHHRPTLK